MATFLPASGELAATFLQGLAGLETLYGYDLSRPEAGRAGSAENWGGALTFISLLLLWHSAGVGGEVPSVGQALCSLV